MENASENTAEAAANLQKKVGDACRSATYISWIAGITLTLFLASSGLGIVGLGMITPYIDMVTALTFLLLTVMLVRWQVKYGRIQSPDSAFTLAKRKRTSAFVAWLFPAAWVVMVFYLSRFSR